MDRSTRYLKELWLEARTRFSGQLTLLQQEDLTKKLHPAGNSAGFLIRHIGDVELLFAKNVFGAPDVKVVAHTVIAKRDTGEWTNLGELLEYVQTSFESLQAILETQTESDWETVIETKEFGRRTKAEALGRISSHTAYHAGQLALIVKYGA
ncbi:MAG: DinB family protein [Bacteroidota bacterium]|jgi:hypothetical protein